MGRTINNMEEALTMLNRVHETLEELWNTLRRYKDTLEQIKKRKFVSQESVRIAEENIAKCEEDINGLVQKRDKMVEIFSEEHVHMPPEFTVLVNANDLQKNRESMNPMEAMQTAKETVGLMNGMEFGHWMCQVMDVCMATAAHHVGTIECPMPADFRASEFKSRDHYEFSFKSRLFRVLWSLMAWETDPGTCGGIALCHERFELHHHMLQRGTPESRKTRSGMEKYVEPFDDVMREKGLEHMRGPMLDFVASNEKQYFRGSQGIDPGYDGPSLVAGALRHIMEGGQYDESLRGVHAKSLPHVYLPMVYKVLPKCNRSPLDSTFPRFAINAMCGIARGSTDVDLVLDLMGRVNGRSWLHQQLAMSCIFTGLHEGNDTLLNECERLAEAYMPQCNVVLHNESRVLRLLAMWGFHADGQFVASSRINLEARDIAIRFADQPDAIRVLLGPFLNTLKNHWSEIPREREIARNALTEVLNMLASGRVSFRGETRELRKFLRGAQMRLCSPKTAAEFGALYTVFECYRLHEIELKPSDVKALWNLPMQEDFREAYKVLIESVVSMNPREDVMDAVEHLKMSINWYL